MTYHILNGDSLSKQLNLCNINGKYIICRECLVDGDLTGDTLIDFWKNRSRYIALTYYTTTKNYYNNCVVEFEKILNLPDNSEIYLWFENDLFCQVNMWFVLSLLNLKKSKLKIFRVFPIIEHKRHYWKGFGISNSQMLEKAYHSKIQFTLDDISLGNNLWQAFKISDFIKLKALSKKQSSCFQLLEEVCQAHLDRFPNPDSIGSPDKTIKNIIENVSTEFNEVFNAFSESQGIYGFGDLQVKIIYDRQIKMLQ